MTSQWAVSHMLLRTLTSGGSLFPRFLPGSVRFHRRVVSGFIDTGKVCRGWAASAKRIIGIWYRGVSFGFLAFSCVIFGGSGLW